MPYVDLFLGHRCMLMPHVRQGSTLLCSPPSAMYFFSRGPVVEPAHDQGGVSSGRQGLHDSVIQVPHNVSGLNEGDLRTIIPPERRGEYPVRNPTTSALTSSAYVPSQPTFSEVAASANCRLWRANSSTIVLKTAGMKTQLYAKFSVSCR